jgi:hypothetical protein
MVRVTTKCSCRSLFRKLDILTLSCLYIYLLMMYVANNLDACHMNTSINGNDMRYKNPLHRPVAKLSESFLLWNKDF